MRKDLAAAAALPQLPPWQYLAYFAGAVAVQFTWGLTAVATRFVQTRAPLPVPTLQLWVIASAIAWVGLLLFYTVPSAVQQQWLKHKTARQHAGAATTDTASAITPDMQQHTQIQRQASGKDDALPATGNTAEPSADSVAQPQPQQQQQQQPQQPQQQQQQQQQPQQQQQQQQPQQRRQQQPQQQQGLWQRVKAAAKVAALSILIGTLLNMSAVGSAGAAKLVNAYIVQLLLLLTPLVCALCNTLLLRQPSPPKLLLAVLLSLAGGGMVVGGYWLQEQQQTAPAKAPAAAQAKDVVLGVVVSLLAMVGQALYFVMVQLTRKSLSAQEVLWGNRNVAFVVVLPLSLAAEGTSWTWVPALRLQDWGAIVFIGIGVQTLGAMGMQWTTRAIGAAAVSSVSPLRLVAAVVGSVAVLQETPTHPLVWCGFVVVVMTMGAYTVFQYKGQQAPQAPASAHSSSSSDGQLSQEACAGGVFKDHDEYSLQEEDVRRSALLASAYSDPSWQLFVPVGLLDTARSASLPGAGRSKSEPVWGQQRTAQTAGGSCQGPRDIEAQQQRQPEQQQQ